MGDSRYPACVSHPDGSYDLDEVLPRRYQESLARNGFVVVRDASGLLHNGDELGVVGFMLPTCLPKGDSSGFVFEQQERPDELPVWRRVETS